MCSAVSTSFWYSSFCSASLSSPLRRNCRCNCCATRLAERSRERQVCSSERTCSATSPLARLTKRESTRTLSTSSPLSVGWWISVCTQVASSRSLRPCVTLACLANSTTWPPGLMECFRLQRVGPADQGGIVGGRFPEQAREPAQHQALVYPIFGFLITPAEQVLEQRHAQQD